MAQIVRPKKPIAGEICSLCGGPAEVDLFWSTSANSPGIKVLKKQTCCGGHPRRTSRFQPSEKGAPRCPVRIEIVASETATLAAELPPPVSVPEGATSLPKPEPVVLRLVPAQPPPPPPRPYAAANLDAALNFLSGCPEGALDEILRLAAVTREFKARRALINKVVHQAHQGC